MIKNMSHDIAQHLIKDNFVSKREQRFIRGSSAGKCRRAIGYALLGYQPLPNSGHSQVILDLGNALHDMLQRKLVGMGWIKAKPVLGEGGNIDWEQTDDPKSGCELTIINHDIRLIGHCDGVTVPLIKQETKSGSAKTISYTPDSNGERYLIEIKSITDRPNFWMLGIKDGGKNPIDEVDYKSEFIDLSYDKSDSGKWHQKFSRFQHSRKVFKKHGGMQECPVYKLNVNGKDELITVMMSGNSLGAFSTLTGPKSDHIAQASLYADQLEIKKILFLYIGKDVDSRNYYETGDLFNLPIKIFEHTVDDLDVEMIKSKFNSIYEYTDKGELPARDYTFDEDKSECKFCNFRHICYPDKIEISAINSQLNVLGLSELSFEPGVIHKAKSDLTEHYSNDEKVI